MTAPTLKSDVATIGAKVEKGGDVISQRFLYTFSATVAPAATLAMVAFQQGFSPVSFVLDGDAYTGTTETVDIGWLYDATTGEDTDGLFNDLVALGSTGSLVAWPTGTGALLPTTSFRATGNGYLTIAFNATTTTTGVISGIVNFTYDIL